MKKQDKDINLKRKCPDCNKDLYYSSKNNFNTAIKLNKTCKRCSCKNREGKTKSLCNFCKNEFDHFKSDGLRKFCSRKCFDMGKNKTNLSKPKSEEVKNKISKKLKGRIISEKQKLNHGIFMRTRFGELGIKGKFKPNFNPQACVLIEEYGKQNGYNFQHALNHGEFYIKELGYWVDGYDKEKNVVIEFYEEWHRKTKQKEKDKKRQELIIKTLNCVFIILYWNNKIEICNLKYP